MNCEICGIEQTYLLNNMCSKCYNLYNDIEFNYKCPECNGKFNQPACNCTEEGTSIVGLTNYRCPFCGFRMKGLNDH